MEDVLSPCPPFSLSWLSFCLLEEDRGEGKICSLEGGTPVQPGVVRVALGNQGDHQAEAQASFTERPHHTGLLPPKEN